MGFWKKNQDFIKKCRGSKFAVECDKISKFSPKVRKSWAVLEKRWVFQKKLMHQKRLKVAILL